MNVRRLNLLIYIYILTQEREKKEEEWNGIIKQNLLFLGNILRSNLSSYIIQKLITKKRHVLISKMTNMYMAIITSSETWDTQF